MRVAVLTGVRVGGSGMALEAITRAPGVQKVVVIFSDGSAHRRNLGRLVRKIWKIGPLGALNGIRMRHWFGAVDAKDVLAEAERLGVEVHIVPSVNSPATEALMRSLDLDLSISLGNGFIASRIFTIPRLGMINYHGELLPDYPGALSIIWPIHDRRRETGFTIHRVARKIDGGDIILQRRFPICFGRRLRDTVELTGATIHPHIGEAFSEVLSNWETLSAQAIPQDNQKSFTTPSIRQYFRMAINNRLYYNLARSVE